MTRPSVDVAPSGRGQWRVTAAGLVLDWAPTKGIAIAQAKDAVGQHLALGGEVQIRIHFATGEFERDITLPRKSDPRRSKG